MSWRRILFVYWAALVMFLGGFLVALASETSGTIDSTNKYAWSENAGWIDFGSSEGSVAVIDTALSGYAWGENVGWISLNCSNDSSCGTVDYKVANDGEGNLSGYAWGENVGWINFDPDNGGVTISTGGVFSGYAWGENIGWIVFNCATTDTCGATDYKVSTDWRPQSARSSDDDSSDSGESVGTEDSGGPDPISEPDAVPVLGFISKIFPESDGVGGRTITVPVDTDITVVTKPVDADRLKSLTLMIGKSEYKLKPTNEDPNNPAYTATIRFTSTGLKAYTLRADYGITDQKEKGWFRVIEEEASEQDGSDQAVTSVELSMSDRPTARVSLPPLGPQLDFEQEAEVVPLPDDEEERKTQPLAETSEATAKQALTPTESTLFDKLGLTVTGAFAGVGNFFSSSVRSSVVIAKAGIAAIDDLLTGAGRSIAALAKGSFVSAREQVESAWADSKQSLVAVLNPSPTPDARIPEHLQDHRYEELQVKVALADGTPLQEAQLTLFSEPKEAITNDQGLAYFQDVGIGEHTLKISFGKFRGEQKLFLKDDVPRLLVTVTPTLREGISPLWLIIVLVLGVFSTWMVMRRGRD